MTTHYPLRRRVIQRHATKNIKICGRIFTRNWKKYSGVTVKTRLPHFAGQSLDHGAREV
jgi:hypothetical protein